MIKDIAEFHLGSDKERAEPSAKREHATLSRGRCFDVCLCGGRRESGPLSGRKSRGSVMELRSPSILIKNT